MENILRKTGKTILLGNEAIVRGALESGVQFVSTYPGTPASEIGDSFSNILKSKKGDFYFEYSVNEKVALEAGIGASFSNLKTLVAMKNFGLNVASDSLLPFCYTGTQGPTVIVVADDPSCYSSAQSEENSRAFAQLAHMPILEPADPQECKDFVGVAFQVSQKYKIPVMVRLTTRVAHQRAVVQLKKISAIKKEGIFIENKNQFVTMPPRVLEMKKELLAKIDKIKNEVSEKSFLNKIQNQRSKLNSKTEFSQGENEGEDETKSHRFQNSKVGIITSGISYLYTIESLKELSLDIPVLKLGFFHPLPEEKIKKFIGSPVTGLKKVLVIEELEPYLEREVERLAKNTNPKIQIFGKNYLSEIGELKTENIIPLLAKITGKKIKKNKNIEIDPIKHLPRFCSGCPYWNVFNGIKKATTKYKNIIFGGDIGCYMMAATCFDSFYDYLSCMGSSIGIGHGIAKATNGKKQKIISFIGDSTFFHSGIPALINCVHNESDILLIILDNQITAMTGHQPHPGIKNGKPRIKIENIIKALEIKNWKKIDPLKNYNDFIKTAEKFLDQKGVSVIIASHPCWLYYGKKK